jgi:hypothetical protein
VLYLCATESVALRVLEFKLTEKALPCSKLPVASSATDLDATSTVVLASRVPPFRVEAFVSTYKVCSTRRREFACQRGGTLLVTNAAPNLCLDGSFVCALTLGKM